MDNSQRRVSLAAFDTADVADIETHGICQFLLGQMSFEPDSFDGMAELASHALRRAHAAESRPVNENVLTTIVAIKNLDILGNQRQSSAR